MLVTCVRIFCAILFTNNNIVYKESNINSHNAYLSHIFTGYENQNALNQICQKGNTFDHDFYVAVDKQCRTENVYAGHQHNIFI